MTKLEEFVEECTKEYLQSVVFVDDNIYDNKGQPLDHEKIGETVGSPMRAQATLQPKEQEDAIAEDTDLEEDHHSDQSSTYHPRQLMESFAKCGVACALYEPREGFEVKQDSEIHRLCKRADVIILDWDLYNDDGDSVSSLLSLLIKESATQSPHQVRLCAIYTDKPDLHRILDRLLSTLESDGCMVEVVNEKYQLVSGATSISIFGKPGGTSRPPQDKPYEVIESDLAGRIIREFALLHQGLLSGFALHGLGAVRKNTKRLFDKFHSGLDGPFLLDRALALSEIELFEELPELLADEIRAVIEDSWPNNNIDLTELAGAVIDDLCLQSPLKPWKDGHGKVVDAEPTLRNQLKEGTPGSPKLSKLKDYETMLAIEGTKHSTELAALYCSRTHYDTACRILKFGTIVRQQILKRTGPFCKNEEISWRYSLCLMPICDSQRLKGCPTMFPFWRLNGTGARGHGLAILNPDIEYQHLTATGKIRDKLWVRKFQPEGDSMVAHESDGVFEFPSKEGTVQWVGELKPLHAQRIAAHLGSEASRVGLVESEWLRLIST